MIICCLKSWNKTVSVYIFTPNSLKIHPRSSILSNHHSFLCNVLPFLINIRTFFAVQNPKTISFSFGILSQIHITLFSRFVMPLKVQIWNSSSLSIIYNFKGTKRNQYEIQNTEWHLKWWRLCDLHWNQSTPQNWQEIRCIGLMDYKRKSDLFEFFSGSPINVLERVYKKIV